ncbi:hypothetical protein NDU88_002192 [Pleurodeles waltl]|uniref:Uncharacterized protein n=1 Tax=Pleurodeles waltl TaxID=8319 RepID=A0AAV7TL22_PLEWA|nr:hypothetical protein NDU88_002192 [Pleurodeles waltl]
MRRALAAIPLSYCSKNVTVRRSHRSQRAVSFSTGLLPLHPEKHETGMKDAMTAKKKARRDATKDSLHTSALTAYFLCVPLP